MPDIGDQAPEVRLPSTRGEVSIRELASKQKVLLAFYTEDDTPLCSNEVAVFKEDYDLVRQLGAEVVGVSADSLDSHTEFARKMAIPFPLASDESLEAARAYGVADEDAKRSRRAVFVIEKGGKIALAVPWFQPGNPAQYEDIFRSLGFDVE